MRILNGDQAKSRSLRAACRLAPKVLVAMSVWGTLTAQTKPAINKGGIISIAGPVASQGMTPGGWVSIYGTNLSATTREWNGADFSGNNLPTHLDDVSVLVDGRSAFVSYISPSLINLQVPDDPNIGLVSVTVTNRNGTSAPEMVNMAPYAPRFKTFDQYVAAQHSDSSLVSPVGKYSGSTPAKPGETIAIYAVGFGPANPARPAGQFITASPVSEAGKLNVLIGGAQAVISYAGLIGPGLYQINAAVPQTTSDGDQPVVATIGGYQTQPGVFVAVKGTGSSAPLPTVALTTDQTSITPGQSTVLRWTVSGATTVSIDQGIGVVALSGSRQIAPISSTTYTLVATNSVGSATARTTVTVTSNAAPTISQFSADSTNLQPGQSTTLRWSVSNATSVSIDNGIGPVSSAGTRSITPSATTSYTLTASGTGGTRSAAVTVSVAQQSSCTTAPNGGAPVWNSDIVQFTGDLNKGDSHWEGFTVSAQTTVYFKSVSDYANQAAIITPDQLTNFKNGGSFTGFAIFDGKFGLNPVTLSPGSYYAAVRYFGNGTTHVRFELDGTLQVPGASFVDYYLNQAVSVGPNGGIWAQPFTIQCGFRYFLDGLNAGVEMYIIDANQFDDFKNNRQFSFYKDYSAGAGVIDDDQPDDYELKLRPGDYYLVYRNPKGNAKDVVYDMSRWR